jgi:hypothetical protein
VGEILCAAGLGGGTVMTCQRPWVGDSRTFCTSSKWRLGSARLGSAQTLYGWHRAEFLVAQNVPLQLRTCHLSYISPDLPQTLWIFARRGRDAMCR